MLNVYRKKEVEGQLLNGIINNNCYFLVDLYVFDDGMIDCWKLVDLEGFRDKTTEGWVVPQVPINEILHVHETGRYRISDADWLYDEANYYDHIMEIIYEMNPERENIYHVTQREKDLMESRRVVFSSHAVPFLMAGDIGYNRIEGKSCKVLCNYHDQLYLARLVGYENQKFSVHGLPEVLSFSFDEIGRLFDDGIFFTSLSTPQWVHIEGLGRVQLQDEHDMIVDVQDKILEIQMLFQALTDKADHWGQRIIQSYHAYLRCPNEANKNQLKEDFEAIPKHRRMYMDKFERDILRILYSDEKREV